MKTIRIEISDNSAYFSYIWLTNITWGINWSSDSLEISFQHHEDNSNNEILLNLY